MPFSESLVQHKTAGKIIMADFDLAKVASEKKILFLYLFLLQRISYKWETSIIATPTEYSMWAKTCC